MWPENDDDDDDAELNVLVCHLTYQGQAETGV